MNPKPSVARERSAVAAVFVFLVVLAGPALAGYGLELVARGDTVQHVSLSGTGEFHFTLTNTGTSSDVFEFDCRVVSGVPGWTVVFCVGGQCVEPGTFVYDTLSAGASDTAVKVSVYTSAAEGEEIVSLRARSMGDSSLAESVATRTIVGTGIEESARPSASGAESKVAPTQVNRRTGTLVTFSTPSQSKFRVTLHDEAGRLVQTVAGTAVSAGRHCIRWQPERGLPVGVYLFRLSAGDASAVTKVIVE